MINTETQKPTLILSSNMSDCVSFYIKHLAEKYKTMLITPHSALAKKCVKETLQKLEAYEFIERQGLLPEFISGGKEVSHVQE